MTAVQSLDSRESPGSVVRRYGSVGIAAAASVSDAFIVDRAQTVFIQTPSGWDAAEVSLQGSIDGSTYAALNSLAGEVSSTAITGAKVVGPYNVAGLKSIKVQSGTSAATVIQTDAVTLLIAVTD